jgi:hypothetical protein
MGSAEISVVVEGFAVIRYDVEVEVPYQLVQCLHIKYLYLQWWMILLAVYAHDDNTADDNLVIYLGL